MTSFRPVRAASPLLAILVALGLAGCAGPGAAPTRSAPESAGASAPGSAPGPAYGARPASGGYTWTPAMAATLDRLAPLRGSPVGVVRTTDDRIWLTLPGDLAFDPGRSALKPAAREALDQLAAALRGNEGARLRIVGHTDNRGAAGANDVLSLDRAASTRDWLVARGVAPTRFAVAGRGARDPVAGNDDDAGRAKNRRVDVLIGDERPRSP